LKSRKYISCDSKEGRGRETEKEAKLAAVVRQEQSLTQVPAQPSQTMCFTYFQGTYLGQRIHNLVMNRTEDMQED